VSHITFPIEEYRRSPLAPLAPHQPRAAREAWPQMKAEFKRALALRRQIRRADQTIERNFPVSELCQNYRTPTGTNGHNIQTNSRGRA
jgi:hypothetical protein